MITIIFQLIDRYSVVSYDRVFVPTIVPKPFYNNDQKSYMIDVLVCLETRSPGGPYSADILYYLNENVFSTSI